MKHKPSQTTTTTTTASPTQDARHLVRETLRISANLASAPPQSPSSAVKQPPIHNHLVDSSFRLICSEEDIDGRKWNYFAHNDDSISIASLKFSKTSIRAVSLQSPKAPVDVSASSLY